MCGMLTIAGDDYPENRACIVCRHVLAGDAIQLVARGDGDLQLLCGGDHETSDGRVVVRGEVDFHGHGLAGLMSVLRPGMQAVRCGAGAEWRISSYEE